MATKTKNLRFCVPRFLSRLRRIKMCGSIRHWAAAVYGMLAVYVGEVENLHDVILNGEAPRVSLEESRMHIATIRALYQSARENKPLPVRH
jgi:predicted dehydrogenase